MEPFIAWRTEVAAELSQAETELSEALAAVAEALATAIPLRDRLRTVRPSLNLAPRYPHLAGALRRRLEEQEEVLRAAETNLANARRLEGQWRSMIGDLRLAIEQLDLILPEEPAAVKAAEVEAV